MALRKKHQSILSAVYAEPTRANIHWNDIETLFIAYLIDNIEALLNTEQNIPTGILIVLINGIRMGEESLDKVEKITLIANLLIFDNAGLLNMGAIPHKNLFHELKRLRNVGLHDYDF